MPAIGDVLNKARIGFACIRIEYPDEDGSPVLNLCDCNEIFVEQTGVPADSARRYVERAFGDAAEEIVADHLRAASEPSSAFTLYFQPSDRWFSCHSRTEQDELHLILTDVTEYHAHSDFTRIRERAYRFFIEHLPMIAFLRIVAPEPVSLFTAGSFREITGYGPERGVNPDAWIEIVHPDDRHLVTAEAAALYGDQDYEKELEYRIVRNDGEVRWVHSYDRQFTVDDGEMKIVQGLIMDVTDRKRHEEALHRANDQIQEQNRMLARLARTDPLTGLLNRRAMQEQLERELRMLSRGRGTFCVLLLDLDHFKQVNDRYGHRAGDRVLLNLAETLSDQVRASDVQARWGGEEFMVLFSGTRASAALQVSQKLLSWFTDHPTRVESETITVTFTGGLVEAVSGDTVDSVFSRADQALYRGKSEGRNRIVVDESINKVSDTVRE